MKTLALVTISALCFNLSAQSLQDSFNSAAKKADTQEFKPAKKVSEQNSSLRTLEANIDYSQTGVQLTWDITSEDNTNKFIIEKSADKNTWIEVSTVFGAAHNKQQMEYLFVDFMPLENLSYYRITQITKKGVQTVSNVIPVNYVLTEYNSAGVNLFPIAMDGEEFKITNIAWEEVFDREILLVLRDKKGEEYFSKAVINIENEHLIAVPIEAEIPSGEYLITATSENQIYSQNITIN